MLELEYQGHRHALDREAFAIGSGSDCDLVVAGEGMAPIHLVFVRDSAGAVAVQPPPAGFETLLNGLRLGSEPTPVLHGDKLVVGEAEFRIVNPARSGETRVLDSAERLRAVPDHTAMTDPAANPGGRLVSLADGREWPLGAGPVLIGRDAAADIVVPDDDASRLHCEILAGPDGYRLVDRGSNGTFVNGRRVPGTVLLARGDRIRIGQTEFRLSTPEGQLTPSLPAGAAARLNDTLIGMPVSVPTPVPSPSAAVLGGLLVRSGERKGERVPMRSVVVNVGRGDFNDLALPDASVSTAHARLQLRDGVWVLQDLDSMNGTWVDGERLSEDCALVPGASLRFGEVKVLFDPLDLPAPPPARPTREMAPPPAEAAPRPWDRPAPPPAREAAAEGPGEPGVVPSDPPPVARPRPRPVVVASAPEPKGIPGWLLGLLLVAALAAVGVLVLG